MSDGSEEPQTHNHNRSTCLGDAILRSSTKARKSTVDATKTTTQSADLSKAMVQSTQTSRPQTGVSHMTKSFLVPELSGMMATRFEQRRLTNPNQDTPTHKPESKSRLVKELGVEKEEKDIYGSIAVLKDQLHHVEIDKAGVEYDRKDLAARNAELEALVASYQQKEMRMSSHSFGSDEESKDMTVQDKLSKSVLGSLHRHN